MVVVVVVGAVVVVVTVESVMGTKEEQKEDALRATRTFLQSLTASRFTSSASAWGMFRPRHDPARKTPASKLRIKAIVKFNEVVSITRREFCQDEKRKRIVPLSLRTIYILPSLNHEANAGLSWSETIVKLRPSRPFHVRAVSQPPESVNSARCKAMLQASS